MFRFITLLVALTVGSAAYAQSAAPHSRPTQHKAAPSAQNPEDPTDVSTVPRHVQKWIGGAVDDILTGADKALDDGSGKR